MGEMRKMGDMVHGDIFHGRYVTWKIWYMADMVLVRYFTREIWYNEIYNNWEIWYMGDMVHGRYDAWEI